MKTKQLSEIYKEIRSTQLEMFHGFIESDFNKYVVVGFQPSIPHERMIGRIVQVREEWGSFGSDQVFIREFDNQLQAHENQCFYKVPDSFKSRLDEIFKDVEVELENKTYSLMNKHKRKGFIVKSKVKKGESTPMRDIKLAILNHL